jgi:hypothetical protein
LGAEQLCSRCFEIGHHGRARAWSCSYPPPVRVWSLPKTCPLPPHVFQDCLRLFVVHAFDSFRQLLMRLCLGDG